MWKKIWAWLTNRVVCPYCGEIMDEEGCVAGYGWESVCNNPNCELYEYGYKI